MKNERKNRTGIPQVSLTEAIGYLTKVYTIIGTNLKSFAGMAEVMDISIAGAKRAFGELKIYGLLEQEGTGWKVSDLGKRVANGDKAAVITTLETNSILKDLYAELKDKQCDRDFIEDYIKKKRFGYNLNVSHVANRFLEALEYINNLKESEISTSVIEHKYDNDKGDFLKGVRLGFKLAKLIHDKPEHKQLINVLNSLMEDVEHQPEIKNVLVHIKENITEGYMKEEKELEYLIKQFDKLIHIEENAQDNVKQKSEEDTNNNSEK
ncbi:Uncharacterised protein [Candidatus Tiddalikarchaeum anstoanum]|nr:Uncharacterised protein [Candidatus Tiddalikarchaeum anstoanum]